VACEDDVQARYGERATIVRPGIVAGPHDPTDRFTYWVRRAAKGGRVALPARPEQPVQVVDSRDLGGLVVALLEQDRSGVFNAVGPAEPTTIEELVLTCAKAAGTTIEIVPVRTAPDDVNVPLVLPAGSDVMFQRSAAAAHAAGMPKTPLEQTAADVLAWDRDRGTPPLAIGLSEEQERQLLQRVS
jgi:2'-hydroxyisoflavone reductase